jgi:hypothetical protein
MRLVIHMSADDSNGNAQSARACAKPAVPCMVYVVGMLRVVASSSARARWHVRACDALPWWMCVYGWSVASWMLVRPPETCRTEA